MYNLRMQQIREALAHALKSVDISVTDHDVHLDHTEDLSHGDYATNVALSYAKQLKMNPKEIGRAHV